MRFRGSGRRASVVFAATAIVAASIVSATSAAGAPVGAPSGAAVSAAAPAGGAAESESPLDDLELDALLSEPPTVPYTPPQLGHGGVRSPVIPASAWGPAERVVGRATGADLGMDALGDPECTPVTVIHVPGSGDTNEQRDPNVPHGRLVSGLGHDLDAEFGDGIRNLYLPYPSDAYLTTNYRASAERGIELLGELVDTVNASCPTTDFAFTGYSQGADVVDGWVEEGVLAGTSAVTPDRIIAITTFGNPRRGNEVDVTHGTAPADSRGIFDARPATWGVLADRVFDSCHSGDLWCEATPAMRRIVPDLMTASLNPNDSAGSRAAAEAVLGPEVMRDPEVREALDELLRFMLGGNSDHVRYEDEVDGAPSARTAALGYLAARISG